MRRPLSCTRLNSYRFFSLSARENRCAPPPEAPFDPDARGILARFSRYFL
jgi:hypothetical protein